ncbi:matrix-remodeling-associated protein 5-like [Hippocampus zosterae]|uniref:matrix-remodeling-associated protein 5-like n=1 Tax=Hippocampus zosterae TaxID=109293 RepID=UPI00223CCDCC|nr:matrix-remodeling-associated protein 5-like [Hippocampus zosterae]
MYPSVGVLLALWALEVARGQACPRSCNCYQANEVHCTFRSLLTVPARLPAHTRRINLGFNSISRIHDSSLAGLQRLELLMLHSNDIHHLPDALFQDLKSLQILKLSYNKLTEIPSSQTFSGLTSLLRLYLDHNHLQYIHPRALLQLPSLRLLRLQGNKLHQLHPHALCTLSLLNTYYFSTLRHLDLSNNSFSTLTRATVQTAPMLETLALQGNPWSCDCRMSWFPAWRLVHPDLMKCSEGLQCPTCDSPSALQGQGLLDQNDLTCSSPVITLRGEETSSARELGEIQSSESFREPLGAASLGLSDQQGNSVELRCNVTHSADSQDASPAPDLSLPSSSPIAMALSFSLECPVERESYDSLWRILAYYSETAVHLERELMLNKHPKLAYRYRQTAETEGYYNTGVKASIATGPHWLMQPAIGIQLNRAQSSRDTVSLIYSTRVSAHPDRTTEPATSTTVSHPWVLILTNHTTTTITATTGTRLELSCPLRSSSHPKVQWILPDGSKLNSPSSSQDGRIQVSDSGLLLQNVELSNAGLYYCVAQINTDSDVLALRLAVEGSSAPPTGEQVAPSVTGGIGQPVGLSCKASGSPEPHTFWVLPDGNIARKGSVVLGGFIMQSNGSLFLPNPSLRDAGHYRCVAVNQYGSASVSMNLEINRRKTPSFGDAQGGPQSASGRSTKIRAPLLRQLEEGSGDEVEEERTNTVHRKDHIHLQHSPNRKNQARKPLRRGPLREGPLRRGERPLSSEQRRNRYSINKQKIDPLKWADLLAKIRQKTTATNNSEDIITENSQRRDDDRERYGVGGNTGAEGANGSEMEGSSVDDAVLREESLQPIYPTHTIAVTMQGKTESKTGTESEESSETQTHESETENVTPTQTTTQTELASSKPTFRTNEIGPNAASTEEQEAKPTFSRVRPSKPQKGRIPNLVPHTRPQSSLNSRRRIGQRRRVNSRTRGRPLTPRRPLADPVNLPKTVTLDTGITQMVTTTTSPSTIHENIGNIKTLFSTSNVEIGNLPSPSVPTTFDISISTSDLPELTSSSPTLLAPYDMETNTDVMTHAGNKPDSAKSTVFKSQTPATTDSYEGNTNTQKTLSPNDDGPSGEKGEGLENNLVDVNESQFSTPLLATLSTVSLTTTPSISLPNHPVTASTGDISVAAFDDTLTSTTFRPLTANPIPLTLPPTNAPMYQITESTTSFFRTDNADGSKDIPSTTMPALSTLESHTTTYTKSATPAKITKTDTTPHTSSTSTTITTTAAASSTAASPGERPNMGQVSPKGRPVSGAPHQSQPPTDWRNPGANFIPDSHSSKPQWSPSPLPATPRSPALRSRPRIADPHFRTVSFPAGNVARLTCEAQGEPKPSITWTKVATGAVMSVHSRTQRFEVLSNGTLVILNVQLQDRGTYICSAHSFLGRDRLLTTLEVWTRPPRMQLASYREVTIHQGGEVHLECQASGVPTPLLSWVLPDRSVLTPMANSGNRISMYQNGTLHISSTLPSDRGAYRCVAANSAGAASASVRLHMSSLPPVIQQPREENLLLAPGGPLYAHCTARGAPPPTLRWRTPDGSLVRPSQFLHGNLFVLPNGTLHIRKIGPKDAGSYECTSFNAVGTDKRTVRVEIKEEAQQAEVILDAKNMPLSTPVLKNKSSSHPGFQSNPLDSARLTPVDPKSPSYPHQSTFADSASKINRTVIMSPSQLNNLTKPSTGTHNTTLTSHTSDKGKASVILHSLPVPPFSKARIVSTSPPVTAVSYGENLQLHCSVTGNPTPIIIWRTPSRKLVDMNFSFDRRLTVHQNGTLSILSVTERDVGDYLCIARNKVADDYRLLRLSVLIKPARIEHKQPLNRMVSFGKALKVDCLASGLPNPAVSWSLPDGTMVNSVLQGEERAGRGRRLIVFNNGTLLVPAVGRGEEGEYTCYAENQGGQDTMKVHVKVMMTSPPTFNDDKNYQVIKVRQGSSAVIRCQATGDPQPTVTWFSPAHRVIPPRSGVYSDRVAVTSPGTLDVRHAQKIDAGNYTCRARNSAGERSMVVGLEVDVPNGNNGYSGRTIIGMNKPTNSLGPAPRSDSENGFKRPTSGITTHLGQVVSIGVNRGGNMGPKVSNSGIVNRNAHGTLNSITINGHSSVREASDASNPRARSNEVAAKTANDGQASWVRGDSGVTNDKSRNSGSTNKLVGVVTTGKQRIMKGQTILLPCPSHGAPPLNWYLPGNGVLPAPYYGSRLIVHRNGSLELRGARVSDSGTFVCVVRGDKGDTRIQVELEVSEPQEVSRPLSSVSSRSSAAKVASQSGRLVPEVARPPIPVSPKPPQLGPSLIESADPVGPPSPSPISAPVLRPQTASLMSITNGETLRLPCSSSQAPKDTLGSLSWTFPSGKVVSRGDSGESGRYLVQEDGTLVIHQTSVFDRGTYTCRSTSPDTSSVSVVTIPVIIIAYPPRITTGPSPVTYTRPGVAVELPCLTIATPRAMVTWETPDMTQLRVLGQARIYGNHYLSPRGSLVIQKPSSRDTGFYRCTAKNVVGVDTKTTYLHVI